MSTITIDHPLVRGGVPLAPLTTYKLGGAADAFLDAGDEASLRAVLATVDPGVPVLVLGRGSNIVFSDTGFPGLVVKLGGDFLSVQIDASGIVTAGGAVPLPRLARQAAEAGRGGLEFYVGIPGSVGGAIRMNAGGHAPAPFVRSTPQLSTWPTAIPTSAPTIWFSGRVSARSSGLERSRRA